MLRAISKLRRPFAFLGPVALLAASAAVVTASPVRPVGPGGGFDMGDDPAPIHDSIAIDRAQAPQIARLVTSAGAHALPVYFNQRLHVDAPQTLVYYGGPTLSSAKMYNIFVNGKAPYWGKPNTFFNNWNASNGSAFQHLLDQYTNVKTNARYPLGADITVKYNTNGTLSDQDIYNIVHPIAKKYGTGYGAIYHVFFKQGVQECSNWAGGCYLSSYCAYHGSVNFSDIGHTLYSFEGFQNVSGCSSPDGKLADSTDSVLSHETYESITDPDINNGTLGWYNSNYGEIGDICRFNYSNVTLNGHSYNIQEEWSNSQNSCAYK